ncbi:MAG TPA: GGDEF domain-containing protein [Acidimicrobiales bacterium]
MSDTSSPHEVTVHESTNGRSPEPAGVGGDGPPVPPDVAARIVRAIDRSPSTVVTFVDADLSIRWISHSATWVTGTDPEARQGASSLERIHPEDVEKLLHGLDQLRAANSGLSHPAPLPEPIRYRFQRFDGEWVVMEATIFNLLNDPAVEGMLVFSRPVGGELGGIGHVVDLLVAGRPLPEVLAACAGLVPRFLGSAAVVAFVDGGHVVGAPPGSPAERLAGDPRWWQDAAQGEVMSPTDFAGFPSDLVEWGRAEGFRSAWAQPIFEQASGDLLGCIVVWVTITVERNIAADTSLSHPERLASLVIAEDRRRRALQRQAETDPLTGLANRSALERRLSEARGPVTIAVLDLDDFKPVNDTYGHETGDAVLRVVGERLGAGVRDGDAAVRVGGDEFAIVFAPGTAPAGAAVSAERVARAVEAPIALDGGLRLTVGVSFGLATARADEVMHLADVALYDAKRAKSALGLPPPGDELDGSAPPPRGAPVPPGAPPTAA